MEQCHIGEAKITLNLDYDRLMIAVRRGIDPCRAFHWEPGDDPKWVRSLPKPEALPPSNNIAATKIVWVVAGCLGENPTTLSKRMIEGLLCREDVKEFFKLYFKWRTKAEECRAGWPWNMDLDYIEELEIEGAGYRAAESITPLERDSQEFINRLVPSEGHPYYDEKLRDDGNLVERERAMSEWRKGQMQRVRYALNRVGRANRS